MNEGTSELVEGRPRLRKLLKEGAAGKKEKRQTTGEGRGGKRESRHVRWCDFAFAIYGGVRSSCVVT